ncbi:acyltransferase [Bradyrhizobium jicamae]|uniref:Acyltransferase n=1 Tax=Bradyrhizobium jicamae TaxID=280332 RepID=A0ABS5FR11_9BRAD|nr:acyltransferase [Bradyrhizobium jicamae]MBR0799223.1 acyltransferase [Bradyrhizobium jicamae]
MTTPSAALHAQLRPVIGAQWINLGLCVALLSVAFALRHGISPAVWIRSTIILAVSLFMLLCGNEMRRGRRWAYVRAKWIAALGSIGFVGVAVLPGPFPAWMRIEQGAQALVFLALTWMMTRPALALFFPRVKAPIHSGTVNPVADASARDASFDYLRAFIVLLVLLHHSVLAYAVMWPAQPSTFNILPAPIVDPQRWAGFDLLAVFNDTFFMALMFLLSGLFVWPGLARKGSARFLRDRFLRLGVPFAVAAGILMPLAYYPSYAVTGADPGLLAYARAWSSLGFWPGGPTWFIGLLLVFDVVAAGAFMLWHRWTANTKAALHVGPYGSPTAFVAILLVVSALVYVPMELVFGADRWLALGPFSLQASRPLLYATYFLVGLGIGAAGTEGGFLARNAGLAQRWPIWVSAGLAAYALRLAIIIMLVLPAVRAHQPLPLTVRLLSDLTVVLCCGTISFAFIALFRRFAIAHHPVFDSLSASSYGMYLIHYPVVVWLQFALLAVAAGPLAKGCLVFVGSVGLSWGMVVALRRIPVIARLL